MVLDGDPHVYYPMVPDIDKDPHYPMVSDVDPHVYHSMVLDAAPHVYHLVVPDADLLVYYPILPDADHDAHYSMVSDADPHPMVRLQWYLEIFVTSPVILVTTIRSRTFPPENCMILVCGNGWLFGEFSSGFRNHIAGTTRYAFV